MTQHAAVGAQLLQATLMVARGSFNALSWGDYPGVPVREGGGCPRGECPIISAIGVYVVISETSER